MGMAVGSNESRGGLDGGVNVNIDAGWLKDQFPELSSLAPLIQGGQKSVYTAIHRSDGSVVLKIIHPSQDPERIRREILAVQMTTCPRVPKIFESGTRQTTLGNVIWIREQRIPGQSLRSRIQDRALQRVDLLRLAAHILEALVDAEKARIVHRDVKPENIIEDLNGNFWLIDFGIARHLSLSSLTASRSPFGVGTIGYAPPEQFRNRKRDIDARADLFALGVTLYECATREQPFRKGVRDEMEIFRNVERMALPELILPCDASGNVAALIAALTQKRQDHRPASASEALQWVREISN